MSYRFGVLTYDIADLLAALKCHRDVRMEEFWEARLNALHEEPSIRRRLGSGDKLIAVNGVSYTAEALVVAIRRSTTNPEPSLLKALNENESECTDR